MHLMRLMDALVFPSPKGSERIRKDPKGSDDRPIPTWQVILSNHKSLRAARLSDSVISVLVTASVLWGTCSRSLENPHLFEVESCSLVPKIGATEILQTRLEGEKRNGENMGKDDVQMRPGPKSSRKHSGCTQKHTNMFMTWNKRRKP